VIGFATPFFLRNLMPRPVSLSPELLQTFVSVVAHDGDAVAAAATLGINQPSMSKRLAQLQHSGRVLRRPWIERKGKTWFLTDEGKRVLPSVEDLVHRYEQLRRFANSAAAPGLAVACGQESAGGMVLAAVRRFRANHPDYPVRVSSPRGEARIDGVANGLFELALVTHTQDQIREIARRELYIEDLYTDPLVLVAAPSSPFAEAFGKLPDTPVSPKALTAFPLVLPEPDSGLRREFDKRLREQGYAATVQAVVETGGWTVALEYVREGFGVGLLPKSVAGKDPWLVVKPLSSKVAPSNTVRLICRRRFDADGGLDLNERGQAFCEALRTVAAAASG
jgi:DNA-binding transcriptional LysR family regulator